MMEPACGHDSRSTHRRAPPPALRLTGIEVIFAGGRKLRIADFHVKSGEQVLIHGPSGHGKTTLLHLLAGLLVPQRGEVLVGADNLGRLSESRRSQLRRANFGILFQTLNLLDHLTALENVLLATSGPHARAAARVALKQVNMAEWADATTATLSLGQQQRVAAARVLAAAPLVILADEPTSSLDQANADLMMDAIFTAAQGATLVMVSHDARIHSRFPRVVPIGEVVQA